MSERVLASPWFLGTTAVVTGAVTALFSGLAADGSNGVRVLALLLGVTVGLGSMLLVAWALSGKEEQTVPPVEMPTVVTPRPTVARPDELDAHLGSGRALLQELEPGKPDDRVGEWIAAVRETLDREKPGVVGYYNALGTRQHPDDRARLDAHVTRLETIARDFF